MPPKLFGRLGSASPDGIKDGSITVKFSVYRENPLHRTIHPSLFSSSYLPKVICYTLCDYTYVATSPYPWGKGKRNMHHWTNCQKSDLKVHKRKLIRRKSLCNILSSSSSSTDFSQFITQNIYPPLPQDTRVAPPSNTYRPWAHLPFLDICNPGR